MGRENLDNRKRRIGSGPELLLIPCTILAASGPLISSARGGMFVMVGLLILVIISMIFLIKVRSTFLRSSVFMALLAGLGTAYHLGWEQLEKRLLNIYLLPMAPGGVTEKMSKRNQISEITHKMIDDYGFFGSGPGSFEAVAQFETGENFTWQSWAHNDYLEFYLTFGKPGVAIIIALTAILILQFLATLISEASARPLKWFGLIAVIGVVIHAIADFPLQVYSILLLTLIAAVTLNYRSPSRIIPPSN